MTQFIIFNGTILLVFIFSTIYYKQIRTNLNELAEITIFTSFIIIPTLLFSFVFSLYLLPIFIGFILYNIKLKKVRKWL